LTAHRAALPGSLITVMVNPDTPYWIWDRPATAGLHGPHATVVHRPAPGSVLLVVQVESPRTAPCDAFVIGPGACLGWTFVP